MQPLDGAYEQISGAREHLDALRPEIEAFAKMIANKVLLNLGCFEDIISSL